MPLIYLSCAWVVGIFLGHIFLESKFNLPLAFVFIGLIPLLLLFLARQHRKLISLTSLCFVALLSGAVYFQASLPSVDENHLQFYNDQVMQYNTRIQVFPANMVAGPFKFTQMDLFELEAPEEREVVKVKF